MVFMDSDVFLSHIVPSGRNEHRDRRRERGSGSIERCCGAEHMSKGGFGCEHNLPTSPPARLLFQTLCAICVCVYAHTYAYIYIYMCIFIYI